MVNIKMEFKHPKYYKELRKRNKSDQAISHSASTEANSRRAPGPGLKRQAASYKLSSFKRQAASPSLQASSSKPQATSSQAASDKLQAPSNKRQASSRKRQAP